MNRPPQEADCNGRGPSRGPSCTEAKCRFHTHKRTCGGAYDKVCSQRGSFCASMCRSGVKLRHLWGHLRQGVLSIRQHLHKHVPFWCEIQSCTGAPATSVCSRAPRQVSFRSGMRQYGVGAEQGSSLSLPDECRFPCQESLVLQHRCVYICAEMSDDYPADGGC